MRSELTRTGTAGQRSVTVALETVVERGICHPKRLGKIAWKLVFERFFGTPFLARQERGFGCRDETRRGLAREQAPRQAKQWTRA